MALQPQQAPQAKLDTSVTEAQRHAATMTDTITTAVQAAVDELEADRKHAAAAEPSTAEAPSAGLGPAA